MSKAVYDVIVVGGGSSGVSAAVSAARQGARVLLIERYGFLGGTLTGAMVAPMMTFHSPTEQVIKGIAQEIVDRLIAVGGSPGHIYDTTGYVPTVTPFDFEALKQVELSMCLEAGVDFLFHAMVTGVTVRAGHIEALHVQTKEGKLELKAHAVVDATGDADLAYFAGVPFDFGRAEDAMAQPATLKFRVDRVDINQIKDYAARHPEEFRIGPRGIKGLLEAPLISICGFFSLLQEARRKGEVELERDQVLFFNTPDPEEVIVNMTRVTGLNDLTSEMLTDAEVTARKQVEQLMAFLRRRVPGFQNARLVATGVQIGLRETRRIRGQYTITKEDVIEARQFEDAIARNAYPIDIHNPDGDGVETIRIKDGGAHTIPVRALLNDTVGNLIVTGRGISTTHEAHASTRLSPVCMAVGQAAGTLAALAAKAKVLPEEVPVVDLQRQLVRDGADLGPVGDEVS